MFLKYNWPGILWIIVIMVLTGTPGNHFPKVETFWEWLEPDKIIHLVIFAILVLLLTRGFLMQYHYKKLRYFATGIALIFGILFGIFTEVMQKYVFVGRHGSIFDFIANTSGCILGFLLFKMITRRFSKKTGKLEN